MLAFLCKNLDYKPQSIFLITFSESQIGIQTQAQTYRIDYSTAQRHCPLTRRPEPARALIVNI